MSMIHAHYLGLAGNVLKRYSWNAAGSAAAGGEIGDGSDDFETVFTPTRGKRFVLLSITVINKTEPYALYAAGVAHLFFGNDQIPRDKRICAIQSKTTATAPGNVAALGPHHFNFAVPRIGNIDEKISIFSRSTDDQQPTIHLDYVEI